MEIKMIYVRIIQLLMQQIQIEWSKIEQKEQKNSKTKQKVNFFIEFL